MVTQEYPIVGSISTSHPPLSIRLGNQNYTLKRSLGQIATHKNRVSASKRVDGKMIACC